MTKKHDTVKAGDMHWHHGFWWRRLKIRWPFFLWVMAILLAVFFYHHGGRFGGMVGVVDNIRQRVAPLETARLSSLMVTEGQQIKRGDILAEMDTDLLDAEIAEVEESIRLEGLQLEQEFAREKIRTKAEWRDAIMQKAEDEGELEALNEEIDHFDELVSRQLAEASTMARLRSRQQRLQSAVALYPDIISELEQNLKEMQERENTLKSWLGERNVASADVVAQDVGLDVNVYTARRNLLELRRKKYVLTAISDGYISRIYADPGEVIQAGESIMTIAVKETPLIIGYVPEVHATDVYVGMEAYLTRTLDGGSIVPGVIIALAPEILELPNRISPFPNRPFRGRRVVIEPKEPCNWIPGEEVTIQLERPVLSLLVDYVQSWFTSD